MEIVLRSTAILKYAVLIDIKIDVSSPSETNGMITITLPVPPQRANDRSHWTKVMREKKKYYEECAKYLLEVKCLAKNILTDKMVETYAHIRVFNSITYVEWDASMDVARLHDFDNLVARLKWPIDALVQNGIIKNDDWLHCRPRSFPTQVLKSKKTDKRELRITLYPREKFE